ncbi:MBL fold metallo-hydrolase [Rhizosaccharibacter radicis]|uniref:MBL fold metallo-hydrolase n=1 Tax=Rhizosaccharibacter radicis TaxID=2782605 RepID=A0ABT1VYU1_9PROT|nr:MBL fold metallo-hydrolase [Acetobacteraceae bacterium KSS12]
MTYHGTNSWLVDWSGGTAVIDPGVEDRGHLEAILREAAGRLTHVIVSHTHRDHLAGAETLAREAGIPTAAYRDGPDTEFDPDLKLDDGDEVAGLRVLHTPGHAMDHLCFLHPEGILFTGDHVMGWSTSVVPPPPYGDLSAFLHNLERVRSLDARLMLSGHGPAIEHPQRTMDALIEHRLAREASILACLDHHPRPVDDLLARTYRTVRPDLLRAARNNLLAHLRKLEAEGRALEGPDGWRSSAT